MEWREKIAEAIYGHANEDHDDARLLADKVLAIPEIRDALRERNEQIGVATKIGRL